MRRKNSLEFVLEFNDGKRHITHREGIIGRNPQTYSDRDLFDEPKTLDFVVNVSGGSSVSRAHLAFGQYESRFWVMDLGSANGTVITYPGSGAFACDPFVRHAVDLGSRVQFGSGWFLLNLS